MPNDSNDIATRIDAIHQSIRALDKLQESAERAHGRLYAKKADPRTTDEQKSALYEQILELERKLERLRDNKAGLDRAMRDIIAANLSLQPPSDDQKAKIAHLIGEVDDLIQDQMMADRLFDLAEEVVGAAQGLAA